MREVAETADHADPGGSDFALIWSKVRRYPLPFIALVGLAAGAGLTFVVNQPVAGRWLWFGTLVVGGLPLVFQTAVRLRHGQFASDIIASLAIVGALALDQAFAGVVIVLMQSSGQAIDSFAFRRATSSLRELLKRAPRSARRRTVDGIEEVPVEAVAVGDKLAVLAGDMLPVDGLISSGEALIDESAVTGEPLPRRRRAGEHVFSGSVNVGPPFDLIAEHRSQESQYARIVELVRTAQDRKPPLQRLADRYAVYFTPLAVAVAAIGWFLTSNPVTALAVLVVATPCPLIIATPIAVVGAVNRAAGRGLVFKSGGAIEEMSRARVVVFDKTGTLTSGRPEVEQVVSFDPRRSSADVLRLAAALEELSSHPLAAATVREAGRSGGTLPNPTEVVETGGAGIEGVIDGRHWLVGSASFVRRKLGVDPTPELLRWDGRAAARGRLVAFVMVDASAAGAILYADRIRPGIPDMVRRLRTLGVEHIVLLTGDGPDNARDIARESEISEFEADLLPEGKVRRVEEFRSRYGSTIMVGDGINDAAALASASVGIAMGARGAGISAEAADVVLLVDDVTRVPDGIALGQRMVRIAKQGIVFGLGASIVLMVIAAGGLVLPALGAILQEVIDLLVILNALRIR